MEEISEEDIRTLLKEVGVSSKEVENYLILRESRNLENQQIQWLKAIRRQLLDGIHDHQQLLDRLDFLIWQTNRRQEKKCIQR